MFDFWFKWKLQNLLSILADSYTIISLELSIRHTTSFWQINASMKRGRKCSLTLAGRSRTATYAAVYHRRITLPKIVSLWMWVVCEHWASYIWQNMLFPRSIDSRLNTFGWCYAGPSEQGVRGGPYSPRFWLLHWIAFYYCLPSFRFTDLPTILQCAPVQSAAWCHAEKTQKLATIFRVHILLGF